MYKNYIQELCISIVHVYWIYMYMSLKTQIHNKFVVSGLVTHLVTWLLFSWVLIENIETNFRMCIQNAFTTVSNTISNTKKEKIR